MQQDHDEQGEDDPGVDEEKYMLPSAARQDGNHAQHLAIVFDADDHMVFLAFKSQVSLLGYAKDIAFEVVYTLDSWDDFVPWFNMCLPFTE